LVKGKSWSVKYILYLSKKLRNYARVSVLWKWWVGLYSSITHSNFTKLIAFWIDNLLSFWWTVKSRQIVIRKMSSLSGGSSRLSDIPPKYRLKTSYSLLVSSYVALLALITLIVSFASPYWLSSHKYTYKNFVRLGLWDFCFDNYRHPSYQYDEIFSGCHWIYSSKYQNIRDWLQPGWFMFIQAMMSIALCLSVFGLVTISTTIMHFLNRHQIIIIGIAFIFEACATIPLFLGWLVFSIMHSDRSWLMYPMYNHLDWAFYVAILSSLLHFIATIMLLYETIKTRERKQKLTNLVYNMQPRF